MIPTLDDAISEPDDCEYCNNYEYSPGGNTLECLPQECPEGMVPGKKVGAVSATDGCVDLVCPVGTQIDLSTTGSQNCSIQVCPSGHYSTKSIATSEYDGCEPCPPGSWTSNNFNQSVTECLPSKCEPGYSNMRYGAISPDDCTKCPNHTYSDGGSNLCLDVYCPNGQQRNPDLKSVDLCIACPQGTYSAYNNTQCLLLKCPIDYIASMDVSNDSYGCIKCLQFEYSDEGYDNKCRISQSKIFQFLNQSIFLIMSLYGWYMFQYIYLLDKPNKIKDEQQFDYYFTTNSQQLIDQKNMNLRKLSNLKQNKFLSEQENGISQSVNNVTNISNLEFNINYQNLNEDNQSDLHRNYCNKIVQNDNISINSDNFNDDFSIVPKLDPVKHKNSLDQINYFQKLNHNNENVEIKNKFRENYLNFNINILKGKNVTEDEILFIKQSKIEFDPFYKNDNKRRNELKNKLLFGELNNNEKLLQNFQTQETSFDPLENLNSLKSNGEIISLNNFKKEIIIIDKLFQKFDEFKNNDFYTIKSLLNNAKECNYINNDELNLLSNMNQNLINFQMKEQNSKVNKGQSISDLDKELHNYLLRTNDPQTLLNVNKLDELNYLISNKVSNSKYEKECLTNLKQFIEKNQSTDDQNDQSELKLLNYKYSKYISMNDQELNKQHDLNNKQKNIINQELKFLENLDQKYSLKDKHDQITTDYTPIENPDKININNDNNSKINGSEIILHYNLKLKQDPTLIENKNNLDLIDKLQTEYDKSNIDDEYLQIYKEQVNELIDPIKVDKKARIVDSLILDGQDQNDIQRKSMIDHSNEINNNQIDQINFYNNNDFDFKNQIKDLIKYEKEFENKYSTLYHKLDEENSQSKLGGQKLKIQNELKQKYQDDFKQDKDLYNKLHNKFENFEKLSIEEQQKQVKLIEQFNDDQIQIKHKQDEFKKNKSGIKPEFLEQGTYIYNIINIANFRQEYNNRQLIQNFEKYNQLNDTELNKFKNYESVIDKNIQNLNRIIDNLDYNSLNKFEKNMQEETYDNIMRYLRKLKRIQSKNHLIKNYIENKGQDDILNQLKTMKGNDISSNIINLNEYDEFEQSPDDFNNQFLNSELNNDHVTQQDDNDHDKQELKFDDLENKVELNLNTSENNKNLNIESNIMNEDNDFENINLIKKIKADEYIKNKLNQKIKKDLSKQTGFSFNEQKYQKKIKTQNDNLNE